MTATTTHPIDRCAHCAEAIANAEGIAQRDGSGSSTVESVHGDTVVFHVAAVLRARPVVVIPAYAADTLGESLTIAAPAEWHDRIRALSTRTVYGPKYVRQIVAALVDLDREVRRGYSAAAYDRLVHAEELAVRYS